jgi:anaerobic glycerol-3-phosphate dehydrogenase
VAGAEPWREKSGEGICIAGAVAAASAILEA